MTTKRTIDPKLVDKMKRSRGLLNQQAVAALIKAMKEKQARKDKS